MFSEKINVNLKWFLEKIEFDFFIYVLDIFQ